MTQFMSIKDVAEYLEVDYKTVYRLVRRGEISSSQIGRVYRLRKADVDAYVESQRLGFPDETMGTPAQIQAHRQPVPTLKCASCLRLLRDESELGGVCEAEGCDELICASCWSRDSRRACPAHRPSQANLLDAARRRKEEGEVAVLVTALEAHQRERAYISRFDAKVQKITRLRHPLSGRIIAPPGPWTELHETSDEGETLMALLRTGFLAAETEQAMPLNRTSRYRLSAREGDRKVLILEVRVVAHLAALVEQGFDSQPATAQDATRVLDEAVRVAETDSAVVLLGLASPTGWSREALDYVALGERGRTFYHGAVLPYLADLDKMTVIYNPGDERLPSMAPLFAPLLLEEGIARVVEYVEHALQSSDRVFVREIARDIGIDAVTMGQAFARLVQSGAYALEDEPVLGQAVVRIR